MKNETMTNAARTYSPAVYLAALKHSAARAAARGAETRRETARRAGIVKLTISAVLQEAEDAAARRAPAPDPETIAAAIAPETAAGTIGEYLRLPGDRQYETLCRAAARVPVWAARAARRVDPDRAAALLPAARWTLYQSGDQTGTGAGDDREIVFRSDRDYEWIARETARGDRRGAIDAIAAETWTRIETRTRSGKIDPADPAWITVYRETMYAAASIGRRDHDRPRRAALETARDRARREGRTMTPEEIETARREGKPETRSLDDPSMTAAARYPSPEAETITRETIRAAAGDDLDRIILRGLRYGWNQGQIARYAGEIAARDRARAAGETLTPEEIENARRAGETYQRRISRKLSAMAERLRAAGVLRPAGDPGYWAAHNPGPAPIASPAITREAREIVTDPARIAAAREIVPADPARETRTAPAVPVPSVMPAPAVLPRPAWETRPAAPAPAPAQSADPETMTPAEIMRRVHANGSPEAETLRRAAALREEYDRRDAIAARSLDRLRAAREEETAARIAAARAAAPRETAPETPEDLRRRETLTRARETVRAAMARRAARARSLTR